LEALQECAQRCQHLRFPFLAMNQEGCWCDVQYGTMGSFKQVEDEECVHGGYAADACGAGPCGGSAVRNAIYAVQPLPEGAAPPTDASAGNFVSRTRVHLAVAFTGDWSFAASSSAFKWSLSVEDATSKKVMGTRSGVAHTANLTLDARLPPGQYIVTLAGAHGRAVHSSTFQLNLSRFCQQQTSTSPSVSHMMSSNSRNEGSKCGGLKSADMITVW
jgi:hypothetical protein